MNSNNWIYFGIFLNDDSKKNLYRATKEFIPDNNWKIFCHHMTIAFNNRSQEAQELFHQYQPMFNKQESLVATHIGISEDAIAVKVNFNGPTANKIPHITIATPQNGKPVNSNYIQHWMPLDEEINLTGIIKPHLKTIKENKNMKQIIRLTESDLHKIIKESVKQLLEPEDYDSIIAAHKAKGEKFWSDPKVKQLKKMGFSKYLISHLQDWYDDISDVPFDVLKKEMQGLKDIYAEIDEENDDNDYNQCCKHPTLQSILRGQMFDGEF